MYLSRFIFSIIRAWPTAGSCLCQTCAKPNGQKIAQNTLKSLQRRFKLFQVLPMSQIEFREQFNLNLNESQMELTCDRMQWRNEDKWGKGHIGIASTSIPSNPKIRNPYFATMKGKLEEKTCILALHRYQPRRIHLTASKRWICALSWNSSQSICTLL